MDVDFWVRQWHETRRQSSLYRYPTDPVKWRIFWDYFAPAYAKTNRENREFHKEIISYLLYRGVITKDSLVLDVGCGPGTYTIPMARKCKKIIGLDTSRIMLDTLESEADRDGVREKIITDHRDWSLVRESGEYDLVFASLTPAISNYESLTKMNRVSGKYCCLISFKGNYHYKLREDLWCLIMKENLYSLAFDALYPLNILYQEGYLPDIAFFTYEREVFETPAYLKKYYKYYFEIFGKEGKETETLINSYIDELTENDQVREIQRGTLGVMHWKVQKQ